MIPYAAIFVILATAGVVVVWTSAYYISRMERLDADLKICRALIRDLNAQILERGGGK